MNIEQVQVLGNRVLLDQVPDKQGRIIIPESAKSNQLGEYIVVKVGDGDKINPKLTVGARVVPTHHPVFQLVGDAETKRAFRIYAAEDILLILPS